MHIYNKITETRVVISEILEITDSMIDDLQNWAAMPYVGSSDQELLQYIADIQGEDESILDDPGAPPWLSNFYHSLLGSCIQEHELESSRQADPTSTLVLEDDDSNELATTTARF